MPKQKTYKCVICGNPVAEGEAVPYKKRYAHERCFNNIIKINADKKEAALKEKSKTSPKKRGSTPKVEVKDCISGEEAEEKKKYFDKLKSLTEFKVTAKMYKVSEDYQKKYGWDWSGMYDCLVYIFDLCERNVDGDCVGLLPYYYDTAQEFYSLHPEKENKDIEYSEFYPKQTVTIKHPKPAKNLIDISEIGGS